MYSKIKLHLSNVDDTPASPLLSVTHYLAQIEVFEFKLMEEAEICFAAEEPTYFMYALMHDNSCRICYTNTDHITCLIPPGSHKMLIITFTYHWMAYKLQQINPLPVFSNHCKKTSIQFPALNMAGLIFRSFNKMSSANSECKRDEIGYTFINGCITKYYNRHISKNKTKIFHAQMAASVKHFIDKNFHNSVADDVPKLAEQFRLSERTLARIAKLAFGIPLHEHVIKLRIQAGLDELSATDKPIYQIAQQYGYNDPHYFSKVFKKRLGISPKFVPRPLVHGAIIEMQG